MSHRFEEEEAQAILREAMHPTEPGLELEEIIRTGAELGIPEGRIREAAERVRAIRRESKLAVEYRRRMRIAFYAHLVPYVLVNGFMLMMVATGRISLGAMTGSLFGWGFGLAAHAYGTFNESGEAYRTGLRAYAESKGESIEAPS